MHFNGEWYRSGTYNGVMKISSADVIYQVLSEVYTKYGTVYELNADTQAYMASKYGLANGGANSSVSAYRRGDTDMDGRIDSFDLTLLRMYLNGDKSLDINLVNSDLNRDGKIDGSDLQALSKLILG